MKRALFGGTFDPPHLAHLHLAQAAVDAVGLDEVIFLPCRQSPHKTGQPQASGADRLAMLRLATAAFPWAMVSDWELHRPPPSYSWQTAEHFAALAPGAPLYWILGQDQWQALPRWNRPERLAEVLTFLVLGRDDVEPELLPGFRAIFLSGQQPGSSTDLRKRLAEGGEMSAFLDPKVTDYLRAHRLYQGG